MKSKTNRILSLTVALIMLLTLATPIGGAYADTEGDYTYTVTDSKATITGYTGTDNNLVIPDTLGGYPVTEIGSNALREKGLIGVTLPNTLVTIGDYAFIFGKRQIKQCIEKAEKLIIKSLFGFLAKFLYPRIPR